MVRIRTPCYSIPMDIDQPSATRLRPRSPMAIRAADMALTGLGAAAGAWLAPFGSGAGGALAGAGIVAGLSLILRRGEGRQQDTAQHSAPPPPPARDGGRAILDRLPLAFLLLDETAQVVFCSTDARRLLIRDPLGQPISAVFRAPAVLAAVTRSLSTGSDETIEFTALRPRQRHLRATVRRLEDGGVVLALRDVSQVHRLDAMRMDFVANASHELRTPLAAITGMVETLQGPARDDAANRDRFLGIIAREAARMARLVDDLLSLSRIELQANIAPKAREDLRPLIAEAVSATSPLAAENGNVVRVSLDDGPLVVQGDRDELLQVFHNLISNAIKYGGPDRPIEITRIPASDDGISIAVRDHGEGVEPSLVPRLTERFFRVNKRESISRGGTGLGLAIVKHILTRHRGELRIESVMGEGSTFTVRLPRA